MSKRGASAKKSRTILTQKKELMNNTNNANAEDTSKNQTKAIEISNKTQHKKAAYLESMNESEKAANFKIIDNMNKRINFLRNPRYKTTKAPITLDKVIR